MPPDSIEAEVRANILAQPLVEGRPDAGAAAHLNLPEPLLSRVADRIIRTTFEERYRNIFEDRPGRLAHAPVPPLMIDREYWPPLRGYRASVTPGEDTWPGAFPTDHEPPELRRAAEHVSTRLASDGLPRTLAQTCDILAPLIRTAPGRELDLLRRAGLPIDLVDFFTLDSRPLLEHVLLLLSRGSPRHTVDAHAAQAVFSFRPTSPGFRAIDEAGSQPASMFRLQVTRPDHWDGEGGGPGSGDNLDLLLHLLRALPDGRFLLSVAANHADALSASLATAGVDSSNITVIPAEFPVSQWAQDNLKPGLIDGPGGRGERVALLPRYASRAEVGAKLDAGDTAALSYLAAAGIAVAHSPLHFQGGNVMLIRRHNAERVLLVGEAEIARNVTLGLTPEQAVEALRLEMGADTILVLPAVGFHIDTEVSARVVGAETIAFVPDEEAAARIIVQASLRAMEVKRFLPSSEARILRTFLDHRNDEQLVSRFGGIMSQVSDPAGNIPAALTPIFAGAKADSGAAGALRMMTSLDILGALRPRPWEHSLHPHAQAHIRALRRSAADRREMHAALSRAGFRVVPVPSLSAGDRSASVINAVHLPGRILLPIRAGFLKPLDDAAVKVLRAHLPPDVRLLPIPVAESERRGGALHCSITAFPDPE